MALVAIDDQVQNRSTGDSNASRDAVMARPGPVTVLQVEDFLRGIGTPLLPFFTAGSLQTIADVEIGEEFFAPDGAKTVHEVLIGDLTLESRDLLRILLPICIRSAQLLERLSALVKRYTCRLRAHYAGRGRNGN